MEILTNSWVYCETSKLAGLDHDTNANKEMCGILWQCASCMASEQNHDTSARHACHSQHFASCHA